MSRPMSIEMVDERGKKTVMVSIDQASVLLDPEDVDAVIQYLSLLRASMQPAIPEVPPRSQQYVMEMDPCWYTEKHPLYDGAVLFLRHTGLGWASFALPTHSLAKLHESLARHLDAEQPMFSLPN
ncbi:hypothetical protein [Burkholderia thailandensis]|uniref:Uncharacterized protein n=2 Tax=Burkholderia thailandensis TaxID=57975 RepID=A0AAW9CZA0_BURTH|nr:hypothetical protein [Burkholderia thailandensis]ABC38419.1 hypothetical protein BTH_I0278 [Burkholderia thailandensis E264]AHI63765.1 hypothetical protein BTL_92 [Burkholderia thailandensis H0587]AHI73115.1 hypothetical protein BTQ_301 [Burkholderia thailandensis 2002721723]AHI79981.1 hypothetical protein BTJ_2184 [Burkholderia thailandensis E444]AIC88924.1 hypothetical protein BTRA_299 [Burkholderia thailandensis USAMRU Malaysia \